MTGFDPRKLPLTGPQSPTPPPVIVPQSPDAGSGMPVIVNAGALPEVRRQARGGRSKIRRLMIFATIGWVVFSAIFFCLALAAGMTSDAYSHHGNFVYDSTSDAMIPKGEWRALMLVTAAWMTACFTTPLYIIAIFVLGMFAIAQD